MRFIKLNENNMVVVVRTGTEIVPGEFRSDVGECGDILQPDGTFITPEPEPYVRGPSEIEQRISDLELAIASMLGGV